MKKLITVLALAFASLSASAGIQVSHGSQTIVKSGFSAKSEAYEAGLNLIEAYEGLTQNQLRYRLRWFDGHTPRNIKIGKTEVQVKEYSESLGDIKYRAIVSLDYEYRSNISRRD